MKLPRVNELDYVRKGLKRPVRLPRREGPSFVHLVLWIASCMGGGFGSAAIALQLMGGVNLSEVGCCGFVGGALSTVLAVPLLVFLEEAPVWMKMLIGSAAACAFTTVSLLALLFLALYAP